MFKYVMSRIIRSIFSIIVVMGVVMVLIFSLMNRKAIFQTDSNYSKLKDNQKIKYELSKYQSYGYIDFVEFPIYVESLFEDPSSSECKAAKKLDYSSENDANNPYIQKFIETYSSKGYEIIRLEGKKGVSSKFPALYATKDINVFVRLWNFFTGLIEFDHPWNVKTDREISRGYKIVWNDGISGMPALVGSGTKYKYQIYFNDKFPFIHQNFLRFNLGKSFSTYANTGVYDVIASSQGSLVVSETKYPTGVVKNSADNLHTASYVDRDLTEEEIALFGEGNQYVNCRKFKDGNSMIGYSFLIGIISTILVYLLGVPIGMYIANHKDKLSDKIALVYMVFIMAVPSLAYIFMFAAIGSSVFKLPTKFGAEVTPHYLVYILPIISLALPSIASLMKWIRRYMIDQMNSDYVKFARSGGLSEGEIFRKHILRNAIIPIVHGIPGSVLGCLTGAIITEKVYAVPGTGKLLTTALNNNDNGMIVALTFFYTVLSVTALILGDVLLAKIDPRISFSETGGRQ